jgi:hypothetical protein
VSKFASESTAPEPGAPPEPTPAAPEPEQPPAPGREQDAFRNAYRRAAEELGVAAEPEPAPPTEEQPAAEPALPADEVERQWEQAWGEMSQFYDDRITAAESAAASIRHSGN